MHLRIVRVGQANQENLGKAYLQAKKAHKRLVEIALVQDSYATSLAGLKNRKTLSRRCIATLVEERSHLNSSLGKVEKSRQSAAPSCLVQETYDTSPIGQGVDETLTKTYLYAWVPKKLPKANLQVKETREYLDKVYLYPNKTKRSCTNLHVKGTREILVKVFL